MPRDIAAILGLKRERNAVVLAHNYQTPEIFHTVADIVGDSLALAREAVKTDADVIVLAGVHFMAETAKLLNPDKTVLIPDREAGCSLADSITRGGCPPAARPLPGRAGRHVREYLGGREGGVGYLLHVGQCEEGDRVAGRAARDHAAGRVPGAEHRRAGAGGRDHRLDGSLRGA